MEIESLTAAYLLSCCVLNETKKISWKWRLKVSLPFRHLSIFSKQRKSPENGDWKFSTSSFSSSSSSRNKENLLKMEIERPSHPSQPSQPSKKQRKSPENGDWKSINSFKLLIFHLRNKENLLKMEIERCSPTVPQRQAGHLAGNKENLLKMEIESHLIFTGNLQEIYQETKKISWKWRLKDKNIKDFNFEGYALETKKISWKWRLKVLLDVITITLDVAVKQRKSPENGDWKYNCGSILFTTLLFRKQRKSPENGDWKGATSVHRTVVKDETKKISWKWRLKADLLQTFP